MLVAAAAASLAAAAAAAPTLPAAQGTPGPSSTAAALAVQAKRGTSTGKALKAADKAQATGASRKATEQVTATERTQNRSVALMDGSLEPDPARDARGAAAARPLPLRGVAGGRSTHADSMRTVLRQTASDQVSHRKCCSHSSTGAWIKSHPSSCLVFISRHVDRASVMRTARAQFEVISVADGLLAGVKWAIKVASKPSQGLETGLGQESAWNHEGVEQDEETRLMH